MSDTLHPSSEAGKFAPQPWKLIEHTWAETSVVAADGTVVCMIDIRADATEETQDALELQAEAHAHLLKASPALLAACKESARVLRERHAVELDDDTQSSRALIQLRAAITLAESPNKEAE